jgi:ribosome biogenesis GTPase
MKLEEFGWDSWFEEQYNKLNVNLKPGRVVLQSETLMVLCEDGIVEAVISDRLNYSVVDNDELPVIGDWVFLIPGGDGVRAQIYDVLPRKTVFISKDPDDEWNDVLLGANIDYICIVASLSEMPDFSVIKMLADSVVKGGAVPLLLFNKTDLSDGNEKRSIIGKEFSGINVFFMSTATGEGVEEFKKSLECGKTYSFTGFIGAGKSSIISAIAGENSENGMDLFRAENGSIIVDTDEISGVSVFSNENFQLDNFDDFMELAKNCRYSDCRHNNEPGCAVLNAVENGDVDLSRYKSFIQMLKKEAFAGEKGVRASDSQQKKKRKEATKKARISESGEWL